MARQRVLGEAQVDDPAVAGGMLREAAARLDASSLTSGNAAQAAVRKLLHQVLRLLPGGDGKLAEYVRVPC